MPDASPPGGRRLTAWDIAFERFFQYVGDIDNVTSVIKHGILLVKGFPDLLELLIRDESTETRDREFFEKKMVVEKRLGQSAAREIEKDFPLMYGHALTGVWSGLESYIEDLAIAWMDDNPSVLGEPAIAKVRIPLATFQALDHQDRLRFIVTELQRDLRVDLKNGATKFEPLLKVLGLDGPVDRRVRAVLFDAQHLRNVLAHRGGVADKKFVEACPNLGFHVGEPIMIDGDSFGRLVNGIVMYAFTVYNRCLTRNRREPFLTEAEGFEGALTNPDEGGD
jgi:hypothetical protein